MSARQPSKLEMAILSLLWEHRSMKAREVLEQLPDRKERAYTSVLSVLQAMERKNLVGHTREGKTNVYHAVVKQEKTVGRVLRDLVRDVFGGSPRVAVQHLLHETNLSEEELQAMEDLLAEYRIKRQSKKGSAR